MSTTKNRWKFNDVLRQFVDMSGKSLRELADESGVSEETLKNWTDGTVSRPQRSRWGDVVRLAAAIGLNKSDAGLLLEEASFSSLDDYKVLLLNKEQKQQLTVSDEAVKIAIDNILSVEVSFIRAARYSNSQFISLVPPLQRPRLVEYFQGRDKELAQLLDDLKPGRVVALCGPGGIGKTALAAAAIWQLAPDKTPPDLFPDGIIYHNFYQRPQVTLALEHIAYCFGEEIKPSPKEAAQRALTGRCALILLDGTEQADDIRPILDIQNQCCVLITSRSRRDALSIRQDLPPLPVQNSIALLQAWGGQRATDLDAVRRISELVGFLPLALRLVGRYLSQTDEEASEYVTWLEKTPLAKLDQGNRQEESVPLLLDRGVAQLGNQAREILGVVGVLSPSPFT